MKSVRSASVMGFSNSVSVAIRFNLAANPADGGCQGVFVHKPLVYIPQPVSYTHLDVYKRQISIGANALSAECVYVDAKSGSAIKVSDVNGDTTKKLSLIHIFTYLFSPANSG